MLRAAKGTLFLVCAQIKFKLAILVLGWGVIRIRFAVLVVVLASLEKDLCFESAKQIIRCLAFVVPQLP